MPAKRLPTSGIADAIVDLSSSGTTLRTNRLRVIDEVLWTSTCLIANRGSLCDKKEKIDEIHLALESVIRARGQCYLMMNVKRSSLETVKRVLPAAVRSDRDGCRIEPRTWSRSMRW